jgi:hypothetical protein
VSFRAPAWAALGGLRAQGNAESGVFTVEVTVGSFAARTDGDAVATSSATVLLSPPHPGPRPRPRSARSSRSLPSTGSPRRWWARCLRRSMAQEAASSARPGRPDTFWLTTWEEPPGAMVTP